eukprot:scaffold15561_cov29-Phaeocystis_antarctica.AAC.1
MINLLTYCVAPLPLLAYWSTHSEQGLEHSAPARLLEHPQWRRPARTLTLTLTPNPNPNPNPTGARTVATARSNPDPDH